MERVKKILFLFHDSGLTGATMVLLRAVRFLRSNSNYELHFALPAGGAAETELRQTGDVHILKRTHRDSTLTERLLGKVKSQSSVSPLTALLQTLGPDLVYTNTLGTEAMVRELLQFPQIPLIWHIHELPLAVGALKLNPKELLPRASLIVANSETTSNYLQSTFGADRAKVVVVNPTIDPKFFRKHDSRIDNVFRICSSGTSMTRKGIEMFILLASMLKRRKTNVRFGLTWIGHYGTMQSELNYDLDRADLRKEIVFTGQISDPERIFAESDAYVCLSKEESFGLAPLEAAACGVPLFCFRNSGHVPEIVQACGGVTVDYMDLDAMANELVRLSEDAARWSAISSSGVKFAMEHTDDLILSKWAACLENALTYKTAGQKL